MPLHVSSCKPAYASTPPMSMRGAFAAASAPVEHSAAASAICSKTHALRDRDKVWSLSARISCIAQRTLARHRFHPARAGSSGSSAAAPATIASWIEGRDLTRKPTPKGNEVMFYTHTLCPYAHRVHLALLEKGVPFQLVHIDLAERPHWFTSLSGLVPLVEYPEGVLHRESLDICRWVNDNFDGPELLPHEPQQREAALPLLLRGAGAFSSAGLALLGGRNSGSWGISRSHSPSQLSEFKAQLSKLGALLDRHGGPFLLGEHVSLVDIVYFPFAERFTIGVQEFCNFDMAAAEDGKIGSWLDAMRSRPHDVSPSADPDLFRSALKKHMRMDFFDYDSYLAAALHPRAL